MPKRSSRKRTHPNTAAADAVSHPTDQDEPGDSQGETQPDNRDVAARQKAARLLGSRGGKKGGPARAKKLSPERRAAIAKKAAKARWSKGK